MKRFPFVLAVLASLLLIFAVLFTSLQLCMNDRAYFEKTYERRELSASIGI